MPTGRLHSTQGLADAPVW
jgi:hypothetical protein